jgi:hypothetical protein
MNFELITLNRESRATYVVINNKPFVIKQYCALSTKIVAEPSMVPECNIRPLCCDRQNVRQGLF